jgi:hypothetical protein
MPSKRNSIASAYWRRWQETGDCDAAREAATAAFRAKHPEVTDAAWIDYHVALSMAGATLGPDRDSEGSD